MALQIVPFYTGILALMYLGLTARVINLRRLLRVGIGDGGHHQLKSAIRVHANFSEFIPLAIILLGFCEVNQVGATLLHAGGSMLVVGRLLHALGLSQNPGTSFGRFFGSLLTYLVILSSAIKMMLNFF